MRITMAILLFLGACTDGELLPTDTTTTDDTDSVADIDFDEDGSPASEDCDDNDFEVYPGADEYCDGKDNDCNDVIDDDAIDADTFYSDADRDGYGADGSGALSCEQPPDTADRGGDCNDEASDINPAATEVCDADDVDEDCDGASDDLDDSTDRASMSTWYVDGDLDGFGDPETTTLACDPAEGRTLDNTDCNDEDPKANPVDGCDVDWDGEWTIEGTVTVLLAEKGASDTCSFTMVVTVDSSSRETVRTTSRGVCYMSKLGIKEEAWLRGSYASDSTLTGDLYIGKDLIPYEARLSPDPDRLTAKGSSTLTFAGYKATVEHLLEGTR